MKVRTFIQSERKQVRETKPEVQKLAKNRIFHPKRYKNGSETAVVVRADLLFDFKCFLSLLMWGYYGVNNLSGACIVVLQLVLLLILKHENIVRSLSQ